MVQISDKNILSNRNKKSKKKNKKNKKKEDLPCLNSVLSSSGTLSLFLATVVVDGPFTPSFSSLLLLSITNGGLLLEKDVVG